MGLLTDPPPLLRPSSGFTGAVPCDGCTECCRGTDRTLYLDAVAEDLSKYKTSIENGRPVLAMKANRDCWYLDDKKGCTIYEDRPQVCRLFDCRRIVDHPKAPWRVRLAAKAAIVRTK